MKKSNFFQDEKLSVNEFMLKLINVQNTILKMEKDGKLRSYEKIFDNTKEAILSILDRISVFDTLVNPANHRERLADKLSKIISKSREENKNSNILATSNNQQDAEPADTQQEKIQTQYYGKSSVA